MNPAFQSLSWRDRSLSERKADVLGDGTLGRDCVWELSLIANAGPGSFGEVLLALHDDGMLAAERRESTIRYSLTPKGRTSRAMLIDPTPSQGERR